MVAGLGPLSGSQARVRPREAQISCAESTGKIASKDSDDDLSGSSRRLDERRSNQVQTSFPSLRYNPYSWINALSAGIDQNVTFRAAAGFVVIICLETAAQQRGGFGGRPPGNPAPIPSPSPLRPPPSRPGWTGSRKSFESPRLGNERIVVYPVPYPVFAGSENPPEDPPYGGGESPPLSPLYQGQPPDPIAPAPYTGPPLRIRLDGQPAPQSPAQRSGGEGCPVPEIRNSTAVEEVPDRVEFFIALKDHSVRTAVAYWVQDETVHYITPRGSHNLVSISLVDQTLSARLNSGNLVPFTLPAR